jgi:hypothetical protein
VRDLLFNLKDVENKNEVEKEAKLHLRAVNIHKEGKSNNS